MASKILFIEDQLSTINSTILYALRGSDYISDKELNDLLKAKTIQVLNDTLSRLHLNFIEFAETFTDALERIQNAGRGSEYCWFFIDRNLSCFSKIMTPPFDDKFYSYFGGFEGDYLYIRLLQAGVPKEKICFLTANGPEDRPFTSSVFFKDLDPLYIIKAEHDDQDESDGSDEPVKEEINDLIKKLKDADQIKVMFKYKKIFCNQKIKALLGRKMEEFIELLARSEYPDGVAGFKFDEGDGTLLRNMIEGIVALFTQVRNDLDNISVRNFINNHQNSYNYKHKFHAWIQWGNACRSLQHFPTVADKEKLTELLKKQPPKSGRQPLEDKDIENQVKQIIEYSTATILYAVAGIYSSQSYAQNDELPPKHIFSYIDNIYTVTSEWSAHGGNPTKVTDLSAEGFRALVYGMCQILDWLADKYPNQSDCNENNQ